MPVDGLHRGPPAPSPPSGCDRSLSENRATVPIKQSSVLLFPVLSGILLFLSFPRANQGYLAWVAFVPLAWFVSGTRFKRHALEGGFVAGAVSWFGLLIWIPKVLVHYGGVPETLAWVLYALMVGLLSCFPAAACFLARFCIERGGDLYLLIFPFAWVALEFARDYVPSGGFPWLLAGYSQTGWSRLMQVADLTGVYGVSFLLLWFNTGLAWALLHRFRIRSLWPIGSALLLAGVSLAYGSRALARWEDVAADHTVAMLQENLSFDEPERELSRKFQEGYVQMASRLKPGSVDLLLLPESPSPLIYQYDASYSQALRNLARSFQLGMVFNNISYEQRGDETRYFNSAYFIGPDGKDLGRYDKIHLVPFGEYVPFRKMFFFVDTISKDVSDFTPGGKYLTVGMQGHRVNAIICFEAVFPELVRRFVRDGSELIVNLTNDRWYGDSAAPYQHLAMARWRAVENRRYLLRAANSGISAIVAPTGEVVTSTPILKEAVCQGHFAFLPGQTPYTRHGDAFAILCVIITAAVLVICRRPAGSRG